MAQERTLPHLLVGGHLYVSGGFRERAGGCPGVRCCVCNCCELKFLVLFCGRTSPPGAHEVYVQNNKLQMNKHRLVIVEVLWHLSQISGLLPLSVGNLSPAG